MAVETAAASLGLRVALRTSTRTYPGSIHWHLKKPGEPRGTLELTYWPKTGRLWAKIHRGRRAKWIVGCLAELADKLAARLQKYVQGGLAQSAANLSPTPVGRDRRARPTNDPSGVD